MSKPILAEERVRLKLLVTPLKGHSMNGRMDKISQKEHSSKNRQAWNYRAYEAWHRLGGSPEEAANKIRQNPHYPLREYEQHLGDVANKRIANLLGSHGRRAVALSLLGARVTVVDISEENCRYAMEFAQASGVELDYIVSDVMEWDCSPHLDTFDIVLMELGLLHYFVDLNPLTGLIHRILKPGGKFVLHEYHPVNKKCLIESDGDRWTLAGRLLLSRNRRGTGTLLVSLPRGG